MHSDLFLRVYQQQERELERTLQHRRAARNRSTTVGSRGSGLRMSPLRIHRRSTA